MAAVVDLNADVGEDGDGADLAVVPWVTTVHVACGFHAGDAGTMARAVAAAADGGVAVGAHPSYPDRAGFGRRALDRAPAAVADDITIQVTALMEVAAAHGIRLRSVKPHGALYHRVATDAACAAAVAGAVVALDTALVLVVPALGRAPAVDRVLAASGVGLAAEAFCDRAYRTDGSLVPRAEEGAVLADPADAAARAVAITTRGLLETEGGPLPVRADTLCLHGDTPGAPAVAEAVRAALGRAGVTVAAPRTTGG